MNRDPVVALAADYDLAFVTCGYEARATEVSGRLSGAIGTLVAFDYASTGVHRYDANKELIQGLASAWIDLRGSDLAARLHSMIDACLNDLDDERPAQVLLDVSSCSRSVLATVLLAPSAPRDRAITLTCVYAIAAFYDPPLGELPCSISEPVIGDLSGWSHDLSKPPCAIIGLGFEPGRALGSIDYLEVPEVRLFLPQGPDARFETAVLSANRMLIDEIGQPLLYDVVDPEDAFQKLTSLVLGLLPRFRPIIIPLGPKIFAALSMLLALRLFPQICIWRTSAGTGEEVADRAASGTIVAFQHEIWAVPKP